ncbi:MAG: hypothetical protein M0R50_12035 [Candidatus Cloacimonetes bacterium]|nr:hypothetical protein [Candidatus Cloacimonadota bacterium]
MNRRGFIGSIIALAGSSIIPLSPEVCASVKKNDYELFFDADMINHCKNEHRKLTAVWSKELEDDIRNWNGC